MRIDRFRTADLDAFYVALRDRGGRGGRLLSVASVRRIHSVVGSALPQAVRWEWLAADPAPSLSTTKAVLAAEMA